jgi:hypothetical protein
MPGIDFHTRLSNYEGYFMEYLLLIDTIGDLSGGTVRVLDGYNATTNAPLTLSSSPQNNNDCWEACTSNSNCILSNFDTTTSACTLYAKPTSGSITNVANTNYTSTMYNNDYYYYMILNLNTTLQASNNELIQTLEKNDITEEELVGANILASELQRQSQRLLADREFLLATMQNSHYSQEYDTTYLSTDSNNRMYGIWIGIAFFSAMVAFFLCYSIITENKSTE